MIYDKDEDQKTVNSKLCIFFFFSWIAVNLAKNRTTIKIVFKLNSVCYTDMSSVQETTISLDINTSDAGRVVAQRHEDTMKIFVFIITKMKSIDIEYMSKHRKL